MGIVTRMELIQRLGIEPHKRITLIETPRGYGKTLLLAEWHRIARLRGVRTALCSAGQASSGESALIVPIAKALAARAHSPSVSTFDELRSVMSVLTHSLVLFFDDIEQFDGRLLSQLAMLFDVAADKVRFVLACAPPCPLAMGRHAVAGRLTRVTSEDLLFGLDDARRFLPGDCTEEDVVELHQLTGGWPLALSALYGSEDKVEGGAEALRAMLGQLVERQPMPIRDLLVTMAITPGFTGQHAAFLTGRTDAHLLVGEARRNGFPLIHDPGGGAYRFPSVVRDYLRVELERSENADHRRSIHSRCAHWHIGRNEPLEALRHALAAEDQVLIEAVTRLQGSDWPMGLVKGMSGLRELSALPLAALVHTPRLWIAAIYALIQNGEIAAADAQMRLLRALCPSDEPVFLAERDAMAVLLRHYHDEPVFSRDIEPIAARIKTVRAPPVIATLVQYNLPMFAAADAADLPAARTFGEAACDMYRAQGAILADAYTRLRVGQFALHQGEADHALALFREVHFESTVHLEDAPHQLMSRSFITEALQIQGLFDQAQTALEPVRSVIDRTDPWPPLIEVYYHSLARNALWRSERARAVAILEDAQAHAHRAGATRLFLSFGISRAEVIGSPGMLDQVDNILNGLCDEPQSNGIFAPWLRLRARLARARLRFADAPSSVRSDLEQLADDAQMRGLVTLAHSARLLGDLIAAAARLAPIDSVEPSVAALHKAGLVGLAFQEGWLASEALRRLPAGSCVVEMLGTATKQERHRRSAASKPGAAYASVTLSPRERDVLDLILKGLSGSEMAIRLALSESSVKSYRNSLYRKFDVQQRSGLIAAVRALGLDNSPS